MLPPWLNRVLFEPVTLRVPVPIIVIALLVFGFRVLTTYPGPGASDYGFGVFDTPASGVSAPSAAPSSAPTTHPIVARTVQPSTSSPAALPTLRPLDVHRPLDFGPANEVSVDSLDIVVAY